jgi:hypothetical protein
MIKRTLLFASIVSLAFTCSESQSTNAEDLKKEIQNCADKNAEPTNLEKAIIGKWQWEMNATYNQMGGGYLNTEEDLNGLTLEFLEDKKLNVYRDGKLIQSTSWKITDYYLTTGEKVSHTTGAVQICEDLLVFMNSPADGMDNYYRKK